MTSTRLPRILDLALARSFAADEATLKAAGTASSPAQIDSARQEQARRYARQRQRLLLVNLGIGAAGIGAVLLSKVNFGLRDALSGVPAWEPRRGWQPARIAAYFGALFAANFVLDAPLSYYSGYVLPHQYGLSTQNRRAWLADLGKSLALSLGFELAAIEGFYFALAAAPQLWWLWTGGALLLVTVVMANLAPVLLLPLFYKLVPLPEGEVRRRALALAETARTRVRGIYSMNMSSKTTEANAMVTGLGNTRRIILGDTLLEHYTPDEIDAVVAHELGHQVHNDIPKLIASQVVLTLGGLYAVDRVLRAVVARVPGYRGLTDIAAMPLIGAVLGVFGLAVLPLVNGYSRYVERQADAYALETTQQPEAFISAMTRLANQNLAELAPSRLVEFLLYNHPSIGKRLEHARQFQAATASR